LRLCEAKRNGYYITASARDIRLRLLRSKNAMYNRALPVNTRQKRLSLANSNEV